MATATKEGPTPHQIDFDLHGLVGIRCIDPSPNEAKALCRQLGPLQRPLLRDPDLTIRFVEHLEPASRVRYLDVDEAAFTDEAFLVLRSRHHARARVQIPMERVGGCCEMVCERGLPAIPLLIPIVNLTALNHGALPLHASAFNYQGSGIVTSGWSKGGKTEMLLAFMAHGAEYVGDEWVYLSRDGSHVYGLPEPLRVWDWHLRDLPRYRASVRRSDLMRWRAIKLIQSLERVALPSGGHRSPAAQMLNRLRLLLRGQLYADVHPERLFGDRLGLAGRFDVLLFAVTHDQPRIEVRPIHPLDAAERIVFSLQHERLGFLAYYLKFRFAFPEKGNSLIERSEEIQREMLIRLLAGKRTYVVYHPYPALIPALFDVVSPLIAG